MQPGAVRAEQHFARAGPSDGLLEQIESAHAGRVREDVRMSDQWVDERPLRAPLVGEAAKVRNDEGTSGYSVASSSIGAMSPITSYRIGSRNRRAALQISRVIAASYRWTLMPRNPRPTASRTMRGRGRGRGTRARTRTHRTDPDARRRSGDLAVGDGIVRVERRKQHGSIDAGRVRPPDVRLDVAAYPTAR